MSFVAVCGCCHLRQLCGLRRVQIILCKVISNSFSFFFLFIIVFPAPQQIMDLTIFLNYVIFKHNSEVKQYSLVDIDTYCFEQELQ